MKIYVGFSTTNSFVSRVIRWFVSGKVSHTYIRFYDEFIGAWLIIHADWPGVIIEDAELFDKTNIVVEEYIIDDPRLRDTLRKNLRHLRKKYNYWNIAYWAWFITFKRWTKKKITNPLEEPKKLICTDFIRRFLADICDIPDEQFNPVTLRKWMEENYLRFDWTKKEIPQ